MWCTPEGSLFFLRTQMDILFCINIFLKIMLLLIWNWKQKKTDLYFICYSQFLLQYVINNLIWINKTLKRMVPYTVKIQIFCFIFSFNRFSLLTCAIRDELPWQSCAVSQITAVQNNRNVCIPSRGIFY